MLKFPHWPPPSAENDVAFSHDACSTTGLSTAPFACTENDQHGRKGHKNAPAAFRGDRRRCRRRADGVFRGDALRARLPALRGGVQQGFGCGPNVLSFGRAERVDPPSLAQPLDHLLQLAPLRRQVDLFGK